MNDEVFSTMVRGESNEGSGERIKSDAERGKESFEAHKSAELADEVRNMATEFKKTMTKAIITAVIAASVLGGAAGFAAGKLSQDKKSADDNEVKIESEYDDVNATIDIVEDAADDVKIATSGNWAGETSNGIKQDYELAGFIDERGAIIVYEWQNEDGEDLYDYGLPIMEGWSQDDWKESFNKQLQGNPTIIGRVASNVLTEDELASVINEYNNKDDNTENDIVLDYNKVKTDKEMGDIAHQLEFAMKDAAEGDAVILQQDLIDAILKEEISGFEHIDEENIDAETSVLLSTGKDPSFADIHEKMVEHHYDKLNGVKVTYANGNIVTYGRCGSAQVVILPPDEEPETPIPSVKTGAEKTSSEKTGGEKTGSEKTGGEKTGNEKTSDEKTGSEKTSSETTIEPKGPDTHAGDYVEPALVTPMREDTNYVEATPENHVEPAPGSSSEANPASANPENTNYSNDELANIFANDF